MVFAQSPTCTFNPPAQLEYDPIKLLPAAAQEIGIPPRLISELFDAHAIRAYTLDGEAAVDLRELEQLIQAARVLQGIPSVRNDDRSYQIVGPHLSDRARGKASDIFTVPEVAVWWKVHPRTVRRWIEKGELKAVKLGGALRVRRSDLDKFLRPVVGAK